MKEHKKKSGFWKKYMTKKLIIVVAVIVVLCGVILGVGNKLVSDNKTTRLGFEDIGELATQTAYCTQVNVTDAARELFGVNIPFTQSKYIYSYDIVIKAGFNFEDIEWSKKDYTIEVKLPEAKILSSDINLESFKVYLEDESKFRNITLKENNEAMKKMKKQAEEDAVKNGLLVNARENAETVLRGFFVKEYDEEKYTIKFVDK